VYSYETVFGAPQEPPAFANLRNTWWPIAGSLAVLLILYGSTVGSLLQAWSRDPLGHGYVVLPAAGFLAWQRRQHLAGSTPAPAFWWLPVLGLVSLVWLVGNLATVMIAQQLCLLVLTVGLIWGALGTAAARPLMFPFGLLVFALPLGDWLVPSLQYLTAQVAVGLLRSSGVPVLLQLSVITVPGAQWEVAWACSGINYLTASLLIAYLYAGLGYRLWRNRISFFVAAAAFAIFANVVRVYLTILLASLGAASIASGMKHYLMGWVVFSVVITLLFVTCGRWPEDKPIETAVGRTVRVGIQPSATGANHTAVFAGLAALVIGIAPTSASRVFGEPVNDVRIDGRWNVTGPWHSIDAPAPRIQLRLAANASYSRASYQNGPNVVQLELASCTASSKIIQTSSIVPTMAAGEVPSTRENGNRSVMINGESVVVNESRLGFSTASALVWSWYSVNEVVTANSYKAKFLLAKSRIVRDQRAPSVIVLSTVIAPGTDPVGVLQNFVDHLRGSGLAQGEPAFTSAAPNIR
jgi:exosortase A